MKLLKIITTAISLLLFLDVRAQVDIGLKFGLNKSNHTYKFQSTGRALDTKAISGYQFGLFLNSPIKEKRDMSFELFYSREGMHIKGIGNPGIRNAIHFLNLNGSMRYFLRENLKIGTGPEVGYILDYDLADQFDDYINISVSWNLSINYEFDFPLAVGLRYNQGIHDIDKSEVILTDEFGVPMGNSDLKQVKRNFQINVYYTF